jgi:ribonuclease Z
MTRAVAHRADVLIHEATFLTEERERAHETGHTTARQAAEIAAESEVNLLALTHVSPRYGGGEVRREARAVFKNTIVPRDFDRVEVPFPERGDPVHVRAGDEPKEVLATSG